MLLAPRIMPEIVISIANAAQRAACDRLAYEIFCEEMGIMREEADHEARTSRGEAIELAHVLHATVDGELAGTMGVLIGADARFPTTYETDYDIPRFLPAVPRSRMALNIRFLVKAQYRGSPLPFRMILEAGRLQLRRGVQLIFCDCQPHLLSLYQSLGFRPCAPLIDVPGFGVMVPLVFSVTDLGHLRAIRSPFLRYAPKGMEDAELAARVRALLPEAPPAASATSLERASWSEAFGLLTQPDRRTRAFEGFSEDELTAFMERATILQCADGDHIIVKGQSTRSAFIVLEGAAEVRLRGEVLARFEKGELFGEFALLLHTMRTADVFAAGERVRLLVLDERTLERLLSGAAPLAARFLLNLSKSLALRLLGRAQ